MRYHTGENPHSCEECGKALADKGALNNHQKPTSCLWGMWKDFQDKEKYEDVHDNTQGRLRAAQEVQVRGAQRVRVLGRVRMQGVRQSLPHLEQGGVSAAPAVEGGGRHPLHNGHWPELPHMAHAHSLWWQYQWCIKLPDERAACGLVGRSVLWTRFLWIARVLLE